MDQNSVAGKFGEREFGKKANLPNLKGRSCVTQREGTKKERALEMLTGQGKKLIRPKDWKTLPLIRICPKRN